MVAKLQDDGTLVGDNDGQHCSRHFPLAINGPGGTGNAAVLKVCVALTVYFAGTATVKKLAPSDAAARLLGGATLHALCKLRCGKTCMTEKRGRLTMLVVLQHRRTWCVAIASYIDEISMISSDQILKLDVRLRPAMMNSA